MDSSEALESTCSNFNKYWSSIYCSPSREYGHVKPQWDLMELSRLLQDTTSALTPADRAYLGSPLKSNDFDWILQHTATGKTPGTDGLPLEYYKVVLPLWRRILEVVYGFQFRKGKMTYFSGVRRFHCFIYMEIALSRAIIGLFHLLTWMPYWDLKY